MYMYMFPHYFLFFAMPIQHILDQNWPVPWSQYCYLNRSQYQQPEELGIPAFLDAIGPDPQFRNAIFPQIKKFNE